MRVRGTLTVYGDGRSVVIIMRAIGDPDLPEAGWKIRRDKETGLIEFKKEDFLSPEKAKALFDQAIETGLLDLREEKTSLDEKLEIQCSLGGKIRKLVGSVRSQTPWTGIRRSGTIGCDGKRSPL